MNFSKEEKAMWLEDWKQSGKSAWAYAKENGLNPQTFYMWVKKSEGKTKEKNETGFVEIPSVSIEPHGSEILIEYQEIKIHIPHSAGNNSIRAVIESLRGVL